MKNIKTELRLEATASLKAEIEKELAVADPIEKVDLQGLCCGGKCHDRALTNEEIKEIYDSTRGND